MSRFTNKAAIVTGAAGALGTSMVRRFVAEGANVVIGARRKEQVTDLVDELGRDKVVFARLDVSDEQQWAAAVRTAEDTFGPVSVLVNNAARAIVGTTESHTADEFREVGVDTNLVGTFLGMHAVLLPSMRRAGGGSIVNINSTAGLGVAAAEEASFEEFRELKERLDRLHAVRNVLNIAGLVLACLGALSEPRAAETP